MHLLQIKVIWLRRLLASIEIPQTKSTTKFIDGQSAMCNAFDIGGGGAYDH